MIAAAVLFDDCFTAGTMFCMLNDPLKSFRVTTVFPLLESNARDGLVPIIGAFKAKFMATFACTQIFGIVHFFLRRISATNGRWTPTHHFIMLKTNNSFFSIAQFWIEIWKNRIKNTWTKVFVIACWYLTMTSGSLINVTMFSSSTRKTQSGWRQAIVWFKPSSTIFVVIYCSQHDLQYLCPHSRL